MSENFVRIGEIVVDEISNDHIRVAFMVDKRVSDCMVGAYNVNEDNGQLVES